jgi:lactoylglutathione lyase
MFIDLAHTAFAVLDVEATLAFYAKLGIPEAFRLHREDGSLMLVYLHAGGDRFIEVFPGGPAPDPNRQQSFMHICLRTDDIHADVERIRAAGIPIDTEVKMGLDHNLQAWIADPDGNKIELMQLSEESPQRTTARRADGA